MGREGVARAEREGWRRRGGGGVGDGSGGAKGLSRLILSWQHSTTTDVLPRRFSQHGGAFLGLAGRRAGGPCLAGPTHHRRGAAGR